MIMQLVLFVCVGGGLGCGRGEAGGWMPLPTRPQRYCDPASLVLHKVGAQLTEKSPGGPGDVLGFRRCSVTLRPMVGSVYEAKHFLPATELSHFDEETWLYIQCII